MSIEQSIVDAIRKEMGTEAVRLMSDKSYTKLNVIPTGSSVLDEALGIGGWPKGRAVEIWGPESCGKSTLICHAIANCQKMGDVAGLIDSEHAYDPAYGAALGVDNDKLIVTQASSAEKQMKIIKGLIKGGCKLVCLDSIAALITQKELDSEEGGAVIAALARLLSAEYKKIIPLLSIHDCCLLQANQIREKPGVMFGPTETTPGGRAVKFYASIRVRFAAREKNDQRVIVEYKVHKNKCARPFQSGKMTINYGTGIDRAQDVVSMSEHYGIMTKRGSCYYLVKRDSDGNMVEELIAKGLKNVVSQLTVKRMDSLDKRIQAARERASMT